MDFRHRSKEEELMDDPMMDSHKYREAYIDINRCNKLLGGYSITTNAVLKLLESSNKKSYTILDMGCGDGEMLRKIAKLLKKRNIEAKLIGIDLRDDIIHIAKSKSKAYNNIEFKKQDILKLSPSIDCDIVLCTLTMHHFKDEDITIFVRKFKEIAKLGVVINDLQRSTYAYYLFKLFSTFFIKTKIAKIDGLISISKGFKKNELHNFAKNIPNVIHTITWKWAFRYVWVMQTNRLT